MKIYLMADTWSSPTLVFHDKENEFTREINISEPVYLKIKQIIKDHEWAQKVLWEHYIDDSLRPTITEKADK